MYLFIGERKGVLAEGSEVRHFGLFIEATDIMTKGMVRIEDFPQGNWNYNADLMRFDGPKGKEFQIGQQHQVQVSHVDMELQRVDFRFVDE